MALRSRHRLSPVIAFCLRKRVIAYFRGHFSTIPSDIKRSPWPDPITIIGRVSRKRHRRPSKWLWESSVVATSHRLKRLVGQYIQHEDCICSGHELPSIRGYNRSACHSRAHRHVARPLSARHCSPKALPNARY